MRRIRNMGTMLWLVPLGVLAASGADSPMGAAHPTISEVDSAPARYEGKTVVLEQARLFGGVVSRGEVRELQVCNEKEVRPSLLTFRVSPDLANRIIKGNLGAQFYPVRLTCRVERAGRSWLARVIKVELLDGTGAPGRIFEEGRATKAAPNGVRKLRLPAPVQDLAVGGSGRYLILLMPQAHQLAVFDTTRAEVLRTLALPAEEVRIAAGREKLLIAFPERNVLQRWNLATLQREVASTVPVWVNLKLLALGAASDGPLFVGGGLIDVATMRPLTIRLLDNAILPRDGVRVRASADGRVFGIDPMPGFSFPMLNGACVLTGSEVRWHSLRPAQGAVGHVIPGPDGRILYTARGLFTLEGKQAGLVATDRQRVVCVPAVNGNYFLGGPYQSGYQGAYLYLLGDDDPIAELPRKIFEEVGNAGLREGELPADQRIHFFPDANLVVTIPPPADQLHLYPVNVDQALARSGRDYLFIDSLPPTEARKGGTYAYRLKARSRKGGVKYHLDTGPPGMQLSAEGQLTWAVPSAFDAEEVVVIVGLTDASGQETFHSFFIHVRE